MIGFFMLWISGDWSLADTMTTARQDVEQKFGKKDVGTSVFCSRALLASHMVISTVSDYFRHRP